MAFVTISAPFQLRRAHSSTSGRKFGLSYSLPQARRPRRFSPARMSPVATAASDKALLFDCDGVIVESEELHRVSYNQCWEAENLGFSWSYEFYGMLQNSIGGGKEKMRWYFDHYGWPDGSPAESPELKDEREVFIEHLQQLKIDKFRILVENGEASIRPGVLRLMDEAAERGLRLAICSAATASSVGTVLDALVGQDRLAKFDVILAGDVVKKKKPDPMIYNLARERLGVKQENCVVIEDSRVGLEAATAAGMKVIITHTPYTADQDFDGAAAIYPSLGEEGKDGDTIVTIDTLFPELVGTAAVV